MLSLHGQVIKTFFSACKRNLSIPFGAIPPVLKACASENAKYEGKRIHCYVFLHGFHSNVYIQTSLIDFYAKNGEIIYARKVFDEMIERNPIPTNCLITAYSKCGNIIEARKLFDAMPQRTSASWNSIIAGYANLGDYKEALKLFNSMQNENFTPNSITFVTVLSLCAKLADLETGLRVRDLIINNNLKKDIFVKTALLGMYVKCGLVNEARKEFDSIKNKDVFAWSSMISGYSQNGRANEALELFKSMILQNCQPNEVTLVSVLSACAQIGSNVEHFACIVDLYCKAGRVNEAYKFILQMKIEPNAIIWGSLLSACRVCKNVELAEISAKKLFKLEPGNSSNYVVLSNIYADAGKWDKAREIRDLMKSKKVEKLKAYSWIELDGETHKFLVGDSNHIKCDEIYDVADLLGLHLEWDNFDHNFELEPL
ncbi:hypothetical protein LUZ60_000406 [Juncus effusus]|nr:hypothetical protein LUZ60_000406 [Juncus effusus]